MRKTHHIHRKRRTSSYSVFRIRTCSLLYEMTKPFLTLAKVSIGDILPFLGVNAIILINFSFSRKANAEKARMLAIVVTMLLRESRTLFEHPY